MSSKITDKDYLYLSAMLSARETRMLTADRAERMIDAPSFDEAAKLLCDCGYDDMSGMSAVQVEKKLSEHRAAIFAELSRYVPEHAIVDAFKLRYDYHNAKVLVKAEGADVDGAYLLSYSGSIEPEKLIEAYNADEFRFMPEKLRTAIIEAKSVLARTENPQLADFVLDKAYFSELSEMAQGLSSDFLKRYVEALADSANLRAAVRTKRIGRDGEFLRRALVPGGSRGIESVVQTANSGEGLSAVYAGTAFEQAAAAGDEAAAGGDLMKFELACDNAVTSFLCAAKRVAFGAEAVVAYIAAVESELTAIRMILTGKLSGVKPEKLKERLRDTYA